MSLPCSRALGASLFAAMIALASSLALVLPMAADAAIPLDLSENMGSAITFPADGHPIGKTMDAGCDVTGDGVHDLLLGAPDADLGGIPQVGQVLVVPGSGARAAGTYTVWPGAPTPTAGTITIEGRGDRAGTGYSVACAGDVNGDGTDDLLVGEYGARDEEYGLTTYVVFGGAGLADVDLAALSSTEGFAIWDSTDAFWAGESVSAVGDVNGDDKDDVIVGSTFGSTGAYVVAGRTSGSTVDVSDPAQVLTAIVPHDSADYVTLARSVGDVDGDGVADIVVGTPRYAGPHGEFTGAAWVISGTARGVVPLDDWADPSSPILFPIWGATANTTFERAHAGAAIVGAGDVNGDGKRDLAVTTATRGVDTGGSHLERGVVSVVYGKADHMPVDLESLGSGGYEIVGPTNINGRTEFGLALAPAGDLNGDGREDLAIGAPSYEGPPGSGSGAAYVVYGRGDGANVQTASLTCAQGARLEGTVHAGGLGRAVAVGGGFAVGSGSTRALLVASDSNTFHPENDGITAIPLTGSATCGGGPVDPGPTVFEADWGFRESFRRYVSNGWSAANPAVPISASAGAFCDANANAAVGGCDPTLRRVPADAPPRRALRWTPVGAGRTDGQDTTIATQGRVTFRYPAHSFTLKLEDPWFVVHDATIDVRARIAVDVSDGFTGAKSTDVRTVIGTFPLDGPAEVTGGSVRWKTTTGTLPADAAASLAGYLGAGAELDPVTITIPRSLGELPDEPQVPVEPSPPAPTPPAPTPVPPPVTPDVPQSKPQPPVGKPSVAAKVSKLKVNGARVSLHVSAAAKVQLRIDRRVGNRWKTAWTKTVRAKKAGTLSAKLRLKRGSYRLITTIDGRRTTKAFRVGGAGMR